VVVGSVVAGSVVAGCSVVVVVVLDVVPASCPWSLHADSTNKAAPIAENTQIFLVI